MFFKLSLLFLFSITQAEAKIDRQDLDIRFIISELKDFSKLSLFLKDNVFKKKYLNIYNLAIKNKPHELFIDQYYDNNNFNLYRSKSSLRYRSRYKNTENPIRNIQFKSLSNDKLSYNEYKLKANEEINNNQNLINYLLKDEHKKSDVILNLREKININDLNYQFSLIQDRDRYYFIDQEGLTIYTISLDRSVYNRENQNKVFNFVEFEINELIYV